MLNLKAQMSATLYGLVSYGARSVVALCSGVLGVIAPTVPFALICLFAVAIDSFTAYRLSVRVQKKYPNANIEAKYKSSHARKIFDTLLVIYMVIVLGYVIDAYLLPMMTLYLANFISAAFCGVQLWSILENESSCNGERWARVLQKVMVDKTSRHTGLDLESIFKDSSDETSR